MQKLLETAEKANAGPRDWQTHRATNRRTDEATYSHVHATKNGGGDYTTKLCLKSMLLTDRSFNKAESRPIDASSQSFKRHSRVTKSHAEPSKGQ